MTEFLFRGEIPASKSIYNRALVAADYFPKLKLLGFSQSEDVLHMRSGLEQLHQNRPIECGDGGTTFRFLALRASRVPGQHVLRGSKRLMSRPHQTLMQIFEQLGVKAQLGFEELVINSRGWQKPPNSLKLSLAESSQFASGVFLNAWNLDFSLEYRIEEDQHSRSYLDLTFTFLKDLGMQVEPLLIPAGQTIERDHFRVESDLSSAFSVAAVGALVAPVELLNFPYSSHQPDLIFVEALEKMGVTLQRTPSSLIVRPGAELKALNLDLAQSPDLFPVMSVLCAFARGRSDLYGAPQLVAKESNRIVKVAELLKLMGVRCEIKADGMIIHGEESFQARKFSFDPDQDHRMAMAAGVAQLKGHDIHILNPTCLNKSFPEFFAWMGVQS